MLSYQHGYHAGNAADVIKHLTLSRILTYMTKKDKPLFYLETHAGKGIYDLQSHQAIKTGEYKKGIDLIWKNKNRLPDIFKPYLHCIASLNTGKNLRYYPGSPKIALDLLRPIDRLYCCELHPKEFDALQTLPGEDKKVYFSNEDGLNRLTAVLPPPEKRALVFIDPSFEIKDDYKTIPALIHKAYEKCPNAVFCLWYPIVNKGFTEQLHKGLNKIKAQNVLFLEFDQHMVNTGGMKGCGLWIINPPYMLESELETAFSAIEQIFKAEASE